ncbi:zinc finger CCHC domain-containing protein [Pimephales promelas]|nr:zinc finger CCHC domain-containing protein [Pimephales promelas]KAG1943884.1 zinc finger CCHC domain-containing protein [Pimephales promelas]
MTRWARANNVHKNKAADATPWKQLKANRNAGESGTSGGGRHIQRGAGGTKSNSKRKIVEHNIDDVNGFMEYLKQTGQELQKKTPADRDLREDVATALKKDGRREHRRIKRQNVKKNNMFGEHLTRDQRPFLHTDSLQILQIPRSMLALHLFSSLHSSGQGLGRSWQKLHFVLRN